MGARQLVSRVLRASLSGQRFNALKSALGRQPQVSWNRTAAVLRAHGMVPKTVFDIGVATGTPEIYDEFPDAHYHLFDPTRESLPHMQAIARRLKATIHPVALGDAESTASIAVRRVIGRSSLYEEVGAPPDPVVDRYEVPVRPFDRLVGDFERPALAKIDVQGAEIGVLRGMASRFPEIDLLCIETSTIATLQGGPEFRDVFALLDEAGFVLWDVVSLSRRSLDSALAQFDAVFIPAGSPLRADKRWMGGNADG